MNLSRREFLSILGAASVAGMPLTNQALAAGTDASALYDVPKFGNVGLLHFTDTHAQLLPIHFREPSMNIGVGAARGQPPHLTGEQFLKFYAMQAGTPEAHAFTCLDFAAAAKRYGKLGGFAYLATLIKRLRADRPGALLLDGGDTWQGSATSLWTKGQDMVDAQLALGVDIMTGHWEFTYGEDRVKEIVDGPFKGKVDFIAQNIQTSDFGDPVFPDTSMRTVNGVDVAVIGQAFPYTPIANPAYFVRDWTFGIHENRLQQAVDKARKSGAAVVVLLSHNGMDVDLKLASRVHGLDAILGGHTHDGVPRPVLVANSGGKTLVTNAGSNGKFLGVLDLDVQGGKVKDYHYRLLPVFANLLEPDAAMQAMIAKHRAPYQSKLAEKLATSEGLLYRRGNFNGSFDQVILDALREVKDTEIAFSPGFRWGTTLLPGDAITREDVMNQTAVTYPATTVNEYTGAQIKSIMEDVCDNLFNPDPYYQQGGDMMRIGGMTYACEPGAKSGSRISDMRMAGKPVDAERKYKVAGWASVQEGVKGEPIWDVVETYLHAHQTLAAPKVDEPRLIGEAGNPGISE